MADPGARRRRTANALLEGDDADTTDAATPTVRLGNICQISDKVARVSGTQQAVEHAGRDDELAYQEMLKGLELKRDIETHAGRHQPGQGRRRSTDRPQDRLGAVLDRDQHVEGRAAAPIRRRPTAPARATTARQRAFTEARLKSVLQAIWNDGGKPGTIMPGGFNKQVFSTFTGRATPTEDTKSKKIVASVDAYESDFGTLKVVANRFQRARDVLVLEMDMWAVGLSQRPQHGLDPARQDRRLRAPPDPVGIRAGGPQREGLRRRVRQHHGVSAACERGHGAAGAVPLRSIRAALAQRAQEPDSSTTESGRPLGERN